ncbi:hypothetical protein CEXT_427551 [Caerostris extrusa]|uniref:Uncharacterized protein n=1 Tax=Caerostris extrusa TaxID=172846 RepID=A0AAV4WPF7_CAEEX|nr:hypothetical protein CEXT_427551 [Caerostris extrusa]
MSVRFSVAGGKLTKSIASDELTKQQKRKGNRNHFAYHIGIRQSSQTPTTIPDTQLWTPFRRIIHHEAVKPLPISSTLKHAAPNRILTVDNLLPSGQSIRQHPPIIRSTRCPFPRRGFNMLFNQVAPPFFLPHEGKGEGLSKTIFQNKQLEMTSALGSLG